MVLRNPKQKGSNLWDCIPQKGECPIRCNQCFYNRPGAFYAPLDGSQIPDSTEVGDGIVRMNCGHDSNLQRDLVIETAKHYKHFFFNTSIPRFDFPGPVVYTANPAEELSSHYIPQNKMPDNLMFVRLRTSSTNLAYVENVVRHYTSLKIPVVLTFMAYYEAEAVPDKVNYEWKVRHINSYFCPTDVFVRSTVARMKHIGGRLVTYCGKWCRDCRNCELYYWLTMKHLREIQ